MNTLPSERRFLLNGATRRSLRARGVDSAAIAAVQEAAAVGESCASEDTAHNLTSDYVRRGVVVPPSAVELGPLPGSLSATDRTVLARIASVLKVAATTDGLDPEHGYFAARRAQARRALRASGDKLGGFAVAMCLRHARLRQLIPRVDSSIATAALATIAIGVAAMGVPHAATTTVETQPPASERLHVDMVSSERPSTTLEGTAGPAQQAPRPASTRQQVIDDPAPPTTVVRADVGLGTGAAYDLPPAGSAGGHVSVCVETSRSDKQCVAIPPVPED